MKRVIIVNGVPASGKSTTAKAIANEFGFPYLSIDTIKEPFMDIHGDIDRAFNREMGKAAYQVIWDTVSSAPHQCTYVIDAWFGFQPKALLEDYLTSAGVTEVLEIWNQVSPELVVERYRQRLPDRKPGHPGEEYIPELYALAERAQAMAISQVITVDHAKPIDLNVLKQQVKTHLWGREVA
ncbi:AAA family ATPase [Vibrio ponticus]|uniref:AAA family ATPase n=1 Tax=Vibrio ponticus TaxID=265668 RepID=A0ABX3FJI0_9VIBR|nr:AAA family ATPase [Vibrio ponticus]OLQ91624.1 AAA family ATPase [Vibrio ponticus]